MSGAAQDEFNAIYDLNAKEVHNKHPEDQDSDDGSTTLHSSNNEDEKTLASTPSINMPSGNYHIPSTTNFNANTGPKGVIADARSFETARKRSFRQTLHALSNGTSPPLFGKNNKSGFTFSREKSPSPDVSADDDEDDFMRRWRANRLEELANGGQDLRTRRQSPSKRKYGTLAAVDPSGYLDAVEKVSTDTTVVVLIYDDQVCIVTAMQQFGPLTIPLQYQDSRLVEDALLSLARKHVYTRFVKLHRLEAEMDEIAAPGILAYRAGDCFANLASLMSLMPAGRDISTSTLESVLQQ